MNSMFRRTSLLLSMLIAASAVTACSSDAGKTETPAKDTAAAETQAVTIDPNDRSQVKDSLPEGLDFGGKTFRIYNAVEAHQIYYEESELLAGDVVNDAVMRRNAAVEERLNITLQHDPYQDTWDSVANSIRKLVMAGDQTYDLFMGHQTGVTQLLSDNCFVNTYELDYLDFSQPWWNNLYMNELSLGTDYRFFLAGDYFITALLNARVVYYNKQLYADHFDNADGLYEEVLDGKWTIDRMAELIKAVYVDVNNDSKPDENDKLGFVCYATQASTDGFVYGTDIAFTSRDADGFIELSMISDDAVKLAEKLNELFHLPGTYTGATGNQATIFAAGNTLFLGNGMFSTANGLRGMEQDFGFLPHPKYDEEQENYHSLVHDTALLGCIPSSSANLDMAGAVIEALNAESYRTVTPAWYETALKVKYARDDVSGQMIDIIHDSLTTNFIYAYNYAMNSIGLVYRELISANSVDYASAVQKRLKAAEKKLEDLVDIFHGSMQ
ncbi:MAG: extracellular solute-binding protein [Clostridia bacterium]|nr:extracellular solute-binding protein [Clostridia bacterium]